MPLPQSKTTSISEKTLDIAQCLEFEDVVWIDVRTPKEYSKGHIPNAINRFWKNNLSTTGCFKEQNILLQEFKELFGEVPSEDVVFYCGSGVTACHNLLATVHAGFNPSRLYAGSWSEWSATPGRGIETSN